MDAAKRGERRAAVGAKGSQDGCWGIIDGRVEGSCFSNLWPRPGGVILEQGGM